MKLKKTSLICLSWAFLLPFGQTNPVSAQTNETRATIFAKRDNHPSLRQELSEIERQKRIKFAFRDAQIAGKTVKVNIDYASMEVNELLDKLLSPVNLTWKKIGDKLYAVVPTGTAPTEPVLSNERNAQKPVPTNKVQEPVSGTVTDQDGQSLPGVSISVKGTQTGTSTDLDGKFQIPINGAATLVVSMIGFETQEIAVQPGQQVTVKLGVSVQQLEEMIVVGFATQKKANLTGAVQSIDAEALANRPVTNVSTAMQGKMAGVTVIQNSGQPGKDGASIRIRGVGTIGNSSPMVIVDGIESSMNNVNPNDIASITVLKDAASAAIYGSKAANGVVLITTKRGSVQAPALSYSAYVGWQEATSLPNYLGSADHAALLNEALANEGKPARFTEEDIALFRNGSDPDGHPNTQWLDKFYAGSGLQQNHNLQLTGGTEAVKYMVSMGYLGQKGIIEIAGSQRYNLRANIDAKISDRLSTGINLAYSLTDIDEPTNPYTGDMAQFFRQINRIPSFINYKYSDGTYGYFGDGNPLAWMDLGGVDQLRNQHLMATANVQYQILDGLKFKQVLSFQPREESSQEFIKDIQYYSFPDHNPTLYQGPNSQKDYRYSSTRLTLQSLLTYDKTFGDHHFGGLAGYQQEGYREDWTQGYRQNFLNNNLGEIDAGAPDGQTAGGGANILNLRSWFGRVNYDYKGKYLLEANIRYDGSSRFSPDNRWGLFPSFSAGWRVSEEGFFKNSSLGNVVESLKLRAGWGRLGNQYINNNYYPAVYSIAPNENYPIGGAIRPGVAITDAANENIKWETTESLNIGTDWVLLDGRITASFDYFDRKTTDILLQLPVPPAFGLPAPFQNAGSVRNNGVELQAGYRNKLGDFEYDISANASYIKNRITDWKNLDPQPHDSWYVYQTGNPVRSFYGYETIGIYRSDEEYENSGVQGLNGNVGAGDLIYKDQNNDGKINGDDRVFIGSPDPEYIFGLNLGAKYKGFELAMFWQGAAGVKGYLYGEAVGAITGSDKPTEAFMDRYHPTLNPDGGFPRALTTWNQNSPSTASSFWAKDASYLRLKNVMLAYNLPENLVSKLGLGNVKIYYSGQNLLTFTSFWDGFDPESPAGGRGNHYPQVKVNTFGLNVNF